MVTCATESWKCAPSSSYCPRSFPQVELGTQLEALFRRSQHRLALDVARASGAGPAVLAGIQQKWVAP